MMTNGEMSVKQMIYSAADAPIVSATGRPQIIVSRNVPKRTNIAIERTSLYPVRLTRSLFRDADNPAYIRI